MNRRAGDVVVAPEVDTASEILVTIDKGR